MLVHACTSTHTNARTHTHTYVHFPRSLSLGIKWTQTREFMTRHHGYRINEEEAQEAISLESYRPEWVWTRDDTKAMVMRERWLMMTGLWWRERGAATLARGICLWEEVWRRAGCHGGVVLGVGARSELRRRRRPSHSLVDEGSVVGEATCGREGRSVRKGRRGRAGPEAERPRKESLTALKVHPEGKREVIWYFWHR